MTIGPTKDDIPARFTRAARLSQRSDQDDRTTAGTTGEAQQTPDSGTAPISVDQEILRHMNKRNDVVDAGNYGEIGRRIQVIGDSCSGKSTLGAKLASALGVPLVELDALNWRPGWVGLNATEPEEFERLIAHETCGDEWVVAGSYTRFCQQVFWPRLQTIIWLDLPLYLLVWRMLRRSWTRWRSRELLWGTNYDRLWPRLKVWN